MSYSINLRKKVIDYVNEGGSKASASKIFEVSQPIIYRWLKKFCLGDLSDPKPKRPWKKIYPVSLLNYLFAIMG
jgi:transposase